MYILTTDIVTKQESHTHKHAHTHTCAHTHTYMQGNVGRRVLEKIQQEEKKSGL